MNGTAAIFVSLCDVISGLMATPDEHKADATKRVKWVKAVKSLIEEPVVRTH